MAGLRRSVVVWVLQRAAQHAFESGARRWQERNDVRGGGPAPQTSGTGAPTPGATTSGTTTSGTTTPGTSTPGTGHDPAGEQRAWAHASTPRPMTLQLRVEDLVRRAWPLLDTPGNRDRAARFVQRMRTVANTKR